MRSFFVYDTAFCKNDEDDPKDALLYFFPAQVTGNMCYSFCCQIVGVAKFFKCTFSSPALIVFDQERFALHWSGNYLFVLGGNRDVHVNILKKQLMFLCGIFCFYHGSISHLMKACRNDRREFLSKMDLAFSRYITLAQQFSNMLQLPIQALPMSFAKKYGDAVTSANQLLHMCQMSSSVIAGAVYNHSRVLSSQLTPELSSYLSLMSNENAAAPVANVIPSSNAIPPDIELKFVYLSQKVIQSVVKYNHASVGSSVRVKIEEKPVRQTSRCDSLSSGSEGDVDSGRDCTYFCKLNSKVSVSNMGKPLELNFKTQLLCCSMHSMIFKRDLLKSKNRTFLRYINSEYLSEKLKSFKRKTSVSANASNRGKRKQKIKFSVVGKAYSYNLLCQHHADVLSSTFTSKLAYKHFNLTSTCDLEFSCYFCINHQFSPSLTSLALKKWNSDMQIPDYLQHISLKPCVHEYNFKRISEQKERKTNHKVQILKCRTKGKKTYLPTDYPFLKPYERRISAECFVVNPKASSSKHQVYHVSRSLCASDRFWAEVDTNKLERSVLYVHRCDANMLLLLLSKNYDEKMFSYFWNCGFHFLKDLDYQVDDKVEEANEVDSMHYTFLYDHSRKIIKERPYYNGFMMPDKYVKESVQSIQEDFLSHSKMTLVSLLSYTHSIIACRYGAKSAFHLQSEQNSRKPESLINFYKKAYPKLEKYLKPSR